MSIDTSTIQAPKVVYSCGNTAAPEPQGLYPVPPPQQVEYYEAIVANFSDKHVLMLADSFCRSRTATDEELRLYRHKDVKLKRQALVSHMHRQNEITKDMARAVVSKRVSKEMRRRARIRPVLTSAPTVKSEDKNGWGKTFPGQSTHNVGDNLTNIGPANPQFGGDAVGTPVAGSNAKKAKRKASKK